MTLVGEKIRDEIAERGAISFARFMELALYCPLCGFYEKKKDTPGQRGDFYTSVSVGPLFGELLAFQFAEWLEELRIADRKLQIVEAGAHDGKLARDILGWLKQRRADLFEEIDYCILEPSARRQEWQRETVRAHSEKVRWFTNFKALSNGGEHAIRGVMFSNELLDAMPVHRLGWDAKRRAWFEWGISLNGDQFVFTHLGDESAIRHSPSAISNAPPELLAVLPDNFTTEMCPAAANWWREAASVLRQGKLVTIDYGLSAEEFFAPQRAGGTLRAYHNHHFSDNLLANPGEQDLTAHVNFTAIQRAGEATGLKTEWFDSQAKFLTEIAKRAWDEKNIFRPWTHEHTRQFQTLTHPEHLGRSFRVLIQSRDVV